MDTAIGESRLAEGSLAAAPAQTASCGTASASHFETPPRRPAGGVVPVSAGCRVRLVALMMLADMVAITAALRVAASYLPGPVWVFLLAGAAAAGTYLAAAYALSLYDAGTVQRIRHGARAVAGLGMLFMVVATPAIGGFAGLDAAAYIFLIGAAAFIAMALGRRWLAWWLDRRRSEIAERVLLIGQPDAVARWLAASRSSHVSHRSVDVITIGDAKAAPLDVLTTFDPRRLDAAAAIGEFWRLGAALRGHARRIDRAVIVQAGLDDDALVATLDRLDHLPFEIALAAPIAALVDGEDPLGRDNCLVVRPRPITPIGHACKRALDIGVASVLLVLLLPILLVIALAIRRGSPGPALFRQERWGWNNEAFTVFKFRTMWFDAEATDGSVQASPGDRRITPIGAFLRSTSLDELPQLLNVLNGTMSLVGPRPHPVELNLRYLGVIERYAGRHRIVPGITGLAQINGCRGETRTPALMQKRVDFDLEYIRTRSFGTDIWILLKTFGSVFRGVNAH